MSQNDKLLKSLGITNILSPYEKKLLQSKWQGETWQDMKYCLKNFGKYAMIRPTGFGKTYTCAQATNIDEITNKKVIFVYVSEILKKTFEEYTLNYTDSQGNVHKPIIHDGKQRIKYETYMSVQSNWVDKVYLDKLLDGVGLIIFDEMQRMGAEKTVKALNVAIPEIEKRGIKYIGASATPERATGVDVCDKFFTYTYDDGRILYCWGEHIYSLKDTFLSGLILPPLYKYIAEDKAKIKSYRHSRLSMLQELMAENVNGETPSEKETRFRNIQELENAIIKDSDKLIHDGMYELYDITNEYEKCESTNELPDKMVKPEVLPEYMRFLVFTPDRKSLANFRKDKNSMETFGGIVGETYLDFKKAFARYGYKIRITIISSLNSEETNNVKLIDPPHGKVKIGGKEVSIYDESEASDRIIRHQPMTIDLIFSINMLNVGYHVNNITGLILKRWTGSNQIYYQQLGRCLSSESNNIPIIFDFVKSIDSRGINAPLFTKSEPVKDITKNADGTKNIRYNEKKKIKKVNKDKEPINKYLLDNEGNPIDPKQSNTIDAHYIACSFENANVETIYQRMEVYEHRNYSIKLFEKAYNDYRGSYVISNNNTLVCNIQSVYELNDSLRKVISHEAEEDGKNVTLNFKAFLDYCKNNNKELFIIYSSLKDYIAKTSKGEKTASIENNINSMIIACSSEGSKRAQLKLLVSRKDIDAFKQDTIVLQWMKQKQLGNKENIIIY